MPSGYLCSRNKETLNKTNCSTQQEGVKINLTEYRYHDLIAYTDFIIHSVPNAGGEDAVCVKLQTRQRTFCKPKLDKQHDKLADEICDAIILREVVIYQ